MIDRIVPIGELPEKGITLCLYGMSKTGKTRLACTFPKPLLLIGTEDGTKGIREQDRDGVDFFRLRDSEEIDEVLDLFETGKYASAVSDTSGGIQDIIIAEVMDLDETPIQKSWGLVPQKQWGPINAQTKKRLRSLINFSESHGMHIVIISHERQFTSETENDLILPSIGSAITPGVSEWLHGSCHYGCQTFLRPVMAKKKIKIGGEEKELSRPTEKVEYCLRVGPHPIYRTGFRYAGLGTDLPDVIVDPNYDKIQKLITQGG